MRVARAIIAAAFLAGCGTPPGNVDEQPFEWSVALQDLDTAMRAVCATGDDLVAVGGRDGATILEWTGEEWVSALPPNGAGRLWWCWIDDAGVGFAVGESGTVVKRTGSLAWEHVDTGGVIPNNVTLYGVWGFQNPTARKKRLPRALNRRSALTASAATRPSKYASSGTSRALVPWVRAKFGGSSSPSI